jgi:antitoxin FitA
MPQLLVRNVPREVVDALKRRASSHGRSAEAEHRAILENTLTAAHESFWVEAACLREKTRGRIGGDSADLIRQDRDGR